jgi:hypothetical protein
MSFASYYRRLKDLPWQDRALLAETTATLALSSFAIGALPFRKVVRMAVRNVPLREVSPALHKAEIGRAAWAIEACARLLPWRIVCFQKGLAMQWMLQRRGVPTMLHYGVAQNPKLGLVAHVWVTHRGEAIIGGEEAPNFACLATFPAAEAEKPGGSGRANSSASRERPGG